MRITSQSIIQRWFEDAQSRLNNLSESNRQVSTGKQLEKASDDPAGAHRLMQINEVVQRNEQYLSNIAEAINLNSTTETAMNNVFSRISRIKELVVESANTASMAQPGVSASYREELKGIRSALADIALTKVEGKFIFNGTAGDVAPYNSVTPGDYMGDANMLKINLGQGMSVPLNLTGDRAFRETEVRSDRQLFANATDTLNVDPANPLVVRFSDGFIDTDVTVGALNQTQLVDAFNTAFAATGANLSATAVDGRLSIKFVNNENGGEMKVTSISGDVDAALGITEGTKNIFSVINDLSTTMETEGVSGVASFLDRIDRLGDNVVNQRGQYGSRARNLEFARDRIEQYNLTNATLKESIEGVDMAKATMRLNTGSQAYEATLAAGSRIFNISILNFLR